MSLSQIEQLQADLATLEAAKKVQKTGLVFGWYLQSEIARVADKIADLEAQQAPDEVGKWKTAKDNVSVWLAFPQFEATGMQRVAYYVKHLEAKVAELEEEIGANESEAYLGDFRVLKTAQDIAKYAESNDIPSCQKAFCRNLINSINDFTLYVRLWEGLHSLAPYKWSSVGLHDKHLINKKECDK